MSCAELIDARDGQEVASAKPRLPGAGPPGAPWIGDGGRRPKPNKKEVNRGSASICGVRYRARPDRPRLPGGSIASAPRPLGLSTWRHGGTPARHERRVCAHSYRAKAVRPVLPSPAGLLRGCESQAPHPLETLSRAVRKEPQPCSSTPGPPYGRLGALRRNRGMGTGGEPPTKGSLRQGRSSHRVSPCQRCGRSSQPSPGWVLGMPPSAGHGTSRPSTSRASAARGEKHERGSRLVARGRRPRCLRGRLLGAARLAATSDPQNLPAA